jgi:phosphotransferase system enzyme I (PtsI)
MDGQPVHFRLLDIGGDKPLTFLDIPQENNPYLGRRGARFLLARPELLKTQARTLARVSLLGLINVIYPMIVDLDQFVKLKNIFNQEIQDLPSGQINHGVMFEVVSACLQAKEILKVADFGTIGSNDLIQYLFAVDRNNDLVSWDYNPDRPVFWSLIDRIAKTAKELHRPISICGELAGDPKYIPKLMELGIRTVSVSSRLIPKVRLAANGQYVDTIQKAQRGVAANNKFQIPNNK